MVQPVRASCVAHVAIATGRRCSLFAAALSKRQGRYGRILRGLVPGIERRGDGATHE